MTEYSELVKALRCKRDDCDGCDIAFFDKDEGWMCRYAAKDDDAADAIEAMQAQLPKREEVWKDVIGYEGLYQVSDQARVRNNKGKILKQSVKVGKCVYYKYVKLYKDGQYRQGYVHRMMAECFIPNPDNLPIINHKDEDGTNNRLDNLEWCTVEYNSNYGNAKRNMSRGKRRRAKMEVQDESAGSL